MFGRRCFQLRRLAVSKYLDFVQWTRGSIHFSIVHKPKPALTRSRVKRSPTDSWDLLTTKAAKVAHFAPFCRISDKTKSWIPVVARVEKVRCGNLDPLKSLDNAPALGWLAFDRSITPLLAWTKIRYLKMNVRIKVSFGYYSLTDHSQKTFISMRSHTQVWLQKD